MQYKWLLNLQRKRETHMAESKVKMKLLIDTHAKRVLFAEADKECVDFLFYILSLPVSTLINLLGKETMVGCLANLYESIEKLNDYYIQPNKTKDDLLKPLTPLSGYSVPLLTLGQAPSTEKKFYRTNCCGGSYFSDAPNAVCPNCHRTMTTEMKYVVPAAAAEQAPGEGGFVKEVVTYTVMDDLVVTPMSAISSITLLNKFNVKDVGTLQEKEVNLGMNEAVKLMKASLESKKVLTDIFLK